MAEAPATLEDIATYSDPEEEQERDSVDLDNETPEQSAINWIRHRIQIPGFEPKKDQSWHEEFDMIISDFLADPHYTRMLVYLDADPSANSLASIPSLNENTAKDLPPIVLTCTSVPPPHRVQNQFIQYFVKEKNKTFISLQQTEKNIQYGTVSGNRLNNLYNLMKKVYLPTIIKNRVWPDNVRRELCGKLHKFMGSLTELANEQQGHTVLYIPEENLIESRLETYVDDSELISRLESTVIHWTKQIDEVIKNQTLCHQADEGPLEEIAFWRARTLDLKSIQEQLQQPGVETIVKVLRLKQSSYLERFDTLSGSIEKGSEEANSNLRFLKTLEAPCTELSRAKPVDIPKLLVDIIHGIRALWSTSSYYSEEERLHVLLRKVSNQIIKQCRKVINLEEIYDGDVLQMMQYLKESEKCGLKWREVYELTVEAEKIKTGRSWKSHPLSIFAQIDAFMQRCHNLLFVCLGQLQFCRRDRDKLENGRYSLPKFGGVRGQKVADSLLMIEDNFTALIQNLRGLKYDILDITCTSWQEDFTTFRNSVKDLEVMFCNVVNYAFMRVSTLRDNVSLLLSVQELAKTHSMNLIIRKKAAEVYALASQSASNLKRDFAFHDHNPPLNPWQPRYGGAALWAKGLKLMAESELSVLNNPKLPPLPELESAKAEFTQLMDILDGFVRLQYTSWDADVNSLESDGGNNGLSQRLDKPLLKGESEIMSPLFRVINGELECNFSKDLLRVFAESSMWEGMNESDYPVPYPAKKISERAPKLKFIRENVMLVVRDFNRIINLLTERERGLFNEYLKKVERRIKPGLRQTWNKKYIVEVFVKQSLAQCSEVERIIVAYQDNNKMILKECQKIRKMTMVHIDKSQPTSVDKFKEMQESHLQQVVEQFIESQKIVQDLLKDSYRFFENDPKDVQSNWLKMVQSIDTQLENAFRHCVKVSQQEICRAILGDGKNEPVPIFRIQMFLDGKNPNITFGPSVHEVNTILSNIQKSIMNTTEKVDRVTESLGYEDDQPSFNEIISNEEDILKSLVTVCTGFQAISEELHAIAKEWEKKYQEIWDVDKVKFIARMENTTPPLETYEKLMTRYKDWEREILREESTYVAKFIHIDCTSLKKTIAGHCEEWQVQLTDLLKRKALNDLNMIHEGFEADRIKLQMVPTNLAELGQGISLVKECEEKVGIIAAKFAPLREMYKLLEKFDVTPSDEERELIDKLEPELNRFSDSISKSDETYQQCKAAMQNDLQNQLERFMNQIETLRSDFLRTNLTTASVENVDVKGAFEQMVMFQERIASDEKRAQDMKVGLDIFGIEQPPYSELRDTKKELKNLNTIWGLHQEWQNQWDGWKDGKFRELDADSMDVEAQQFFMKVMKLQKKMGSWKTWKVAREIVENFRATVPLINDLKNPAMRPRHWTQLKEIIQNHDFDPYSDDFTLESVEKLELYKFAEQIAEISGNANKEQNIEKGIDEIATIWSTLPLVMGRYKGKYYRILTTEDLMQNLDDHQVQLSTMKSSPFYGTFEEQINGWVMKLSDIAEMTDLTIQLQKQWIYLESIFVGSDEIRRQLAVESRIFDSSNQKFIAIMNEWHERPIIQDCFLAEGISDKVNKIKETLEKVQRCLNDYLETKRMAFPRFYFLSDDDLLEILGNAKEPVKVNKRMGKLFTGIKNLELIEPSSSLGASKNWKVRGMKDKSGETVNFVSDMEINGSVENWLTNVERCMQRALEKGLHTCLSQIIAHPKKKDLQWISNSPGQLLILAGQIAWTSACENALANIEENPKGLRKIWKQWRKYLRRCSNMVRGDLAKLSRKKLFSLITIEVHARDVIERMMKSSSCTNVAAFEWQSQLRFEYIKEEGEYGQAYMLQTNSRFQYEYEYQGNNGRLVVTPLTDRCYLTLTTALNLNLGGSPAGPAGTGKTETVKDLGKCLGKMVVVFNCSDKLDQVTLGGWFAGLAQCGAWGCYDEFNRILIEVLSVVTQQIDTILTAVRAKQDVFTFEGRMMNLNPNVGIFITMNPGYAGRTELPDNLKALFRPVAMMVPDNQLIAEVFLVAGGFLDAKTLAQKICVLFELAFQQFSKQDHYDWTLRSIIAVLRRSGAIYRENKDQSEEIVVMRALQDMNLCKLLDMDATLFRGLFKDLFPSAELPDPDYGELLKAIHETLLEDGLQICDVIASKAIQLFEAFSTRHGNMIVGLTNGGKTTIIKTLAKAMCKLNKRGFPFQAAEYHILNPKAVTMERLYGFFDPATREWCDGILSSTLRKVSEVESKTWKWVWLDGPVDTLWIESMNTVLDDNKLLTLINGDRIALPPNVFMLFEVQDLKVASPATVSRVGIVYVDKNMGWRPMVESWIKEKAAFLGERGQESLLKLFDQYVEDLLEFKRLNCIELISIDDCNAVQSLCRLFESLVTPKELDPSDADFERMLEMWFLFCTIWSIGGALTKESRLKFDVKLREGQATLPPLETVYDSFIDPQKKSWCMWKEKLPDEWSPLPGTPYYKLIVPTVDTLRNHYLIDAMQKKTFPMIATGKTGTGKTVAISSLLSEFDQTKDLCLSINFSSATKAEAIQNIFDSKLVKHHGDHFVPKGGRERLVVFIDDLNIPAKDEFGSQPPLELLRQWMEHKFWFNLERCVPRNIGQMQLLAAMGPPGGARSIISKRFQSKMNILNFVFPDDDSIRNIFGSILNLRLTQLNFHQDVKSLAPTITDATLELYQSVIVKFLPTPSKSHYVFNLRDMGKVVQGMLGADRNFCDSKDDAVKIWIHESMRVFYDRMVNDQDREEFIVTLDGLLQKHFDSSWKMAVGEKQSGPLFTCFFGNSAEEKDEDDDDDENEVVDLPYQEAEDMSKLKELIEEKLEMYNYVPANTSMDLVLFEDAIRHICHINRIIKQDRGHALLVGVGGSGRQSLTRLATYIAGYELSQIAIGKGYTKVDFYEDLKQLFIQTGQECKQTVFLFADTQLVEMSFLEDINSMLSTGEVPGLFPIEELSPILDSLRSDAKKNGINESEESLYNYFIERAQNHLHIVFCMSPIGDLFIDSVRMYPSLVNSTTIKWFPEWPKSALKEVSSKFMMDIQFANEDTADGIAEFFCSAHVAVSNMAEKMKQEVKRHTYVTPTSYLSLVTSYRDLLQKKRREIQKAADRLINGLNKIDEAKEQVREMSIGLEKVKKTVSKKQIECEKLLVKIIAQQREADEKKQKAEKEKEKTAGEEAACMELAARCNEDLSAAEVPLRKAEESLKNLSKNAVTEVRSYAQPPEVVAIVMSAVMTLLRKDTDWKTAKGELAKGTFLQSLREYPKDKIGTSLLKKIKKYTSLDYFNYEDVKSKSIAAAALCDWVCAMEVYAIVNRDVEPKRKQLRDAQKTLEEKQACLKAILDELAVIEGALAKLQKGFDDSEAEKKALADKADELETKLTRAGQLVEGLTGERSRWEITIEKYKADLVNVDGDCALAASFLSYCGPFDSSYRQMLVQDKWMDMIQEIGIPVSNDFQFASFMVEPTEIRNWSLCGLPTDDFSKDNGVLLSCGSRWPLMIDPQCQANKFIKKLYSGRLQVVDPKMDFMRILEGAVQFGTPVLMQDVSTELDAALNPILLKDFIVEGNRRYLKLGDKQVEFNEDFRFFLTTREANPHFSPEVCVKTVVVNFAVKLSGLEDQLLGTVVQAEEPQLEEEKSKLVVQVAGCKKQLADLESEILNLLRDAEGSLLDDTTLIDTLQKSKKTSEEVKEALRVGEETEKNIDVARENYRPSAKMASIIYFVLIDLSKVDPMYQFSLDSYIDLYKRSITESRKLSDDFDTLDDRIRKLNDFHTRSVYANTCRGLFEKHKLLFSFLLCIKKLQQEDKINPEEYSFFLRGGQVMNRNLLPENENSDWINEGAWDNCTELRKLDAFSDLLDSFSQSTRQWKEWVFEERPEKARLPGDWDNRLDQFQKMCVLRCLRPDRVVFNIRDFISSNLGSYYVTPPPFKLDEVLADSTPYTPIIFVLNVGSDPTAQLNALGKAKEKQILSLSLGAGQDKPATIMLENGLRQGHWVFFANCHLSISWMPDLEQLIENYCAGKGTTPHPEFRLWLSCKPHPSFPIAILQRSLKITTEPPTGLRMNMLRLYTNLSKEQFSACNKPSKYKKLLFSLVWFHSLLLERRKFGSLGWNILYDFNETDFRTSENILNLYLSQYDETPWEALRYLVAEVNYGGRVTDDCDRHLLNTYVQQFICKSAVDSANYPLSELPQYFIPNDGDIDSYKDYVLSLPVGAEHPGAFGQHVNADMSSHLKETDILLDTVLSLQANMSTGAGASMEETVLQLACALEEKIPEPMDMDALVKRYGKSDSPLSVVLVQESERYDHLLHVIRRSLQELKKGIQGLVVISPEIEAVCQAIYQGKVPELWKQTYPSLKPLGTWTRDLIARIDQLRTWAFEAQPKVFWLAGFTFPTGFLTALLQIKARESGVAIDNFGWSFVPMQDKDDIMGLTIQEAPAADDGAFISGLFLEGAGWDYGKMCLTEPEPMKLSVNMPVIHFRPIEKKKMPKGLYAAPTYIYPIRTGTRERPSFMLNIDLDSGEKDPTHWTKRGTALLLSLSD